MNLAVFSFSRGTNTFTSCARQEAFPEASRNSVALDVGELQGSTRGHFSRTWPASEWPGDASPCPSDGANASSDEDGEGETSEFEMPSSAFGSESSSSDSSSAPECAGQRAGDYENKAGDDNRGIDKDFAIRD